MYIYDGQTYESKDDAPDLGSLVCTSHHEDIRNYEGKWADKDKLPKYDDLGTGSSAFLSDNGKFILCKYYKDTKTWEAKGQVW